MPLLIGDAADGDDWADELSPADCCCSVAHAPRLFGGDSRLVRNRLQAGSGLNPSAGQLRAGCGLALTRCGEQLGLRTPVASQRRSTSAQASSQVAAQAPW